MIAIHVMISFPVVLCRNTLPIVGVVTILFHFAFLFAYLITKFFPVQMQFYIKLRYQT